MSLALHYSTTAIAMLFLASCTNGVDKAQPPHQGPARQFSDSDKQIARYLSLGNEALLGQDTDPHQEALICRDALTAIEHRLRSTGILKGELAHSLGLAKAIYERRAAAQASTPGASAGPSPEPAVAAQGDSSTQFDEGRTALACIERLQPSDLQ